MSPRVTAVSLARDVSEYRATLLLAKISVFPLSRPCFRLFVYVCPPQEKTCIAKKIAATSARPRVSRRVNTHETPYISAPDVEPTCNDGLYLLNALSPFPLFLPAHARSLSSGFGPGRFLVRGLWVSVSPFYFFLFFLWFLWFQQGRPAHLAHLHELLPL